jgi:integrase
MPIIKTKREDILRNFEIDRMLTKADKGIVKYLPIELQPNSMDMTIRFNPARVKCLIALLWLFGKRITEYLWLKRKDLWVERNYLYVRFTVQKKRKRGAQPIKERYLKRITLENPYAEFVIQYIEGIADPEAFLFPSDRSAYGYTSRNHAYRILKGLDRDAWCHLFRESLATKMAEEGATEEELMHWFDWDNPQSAHKYVKKGTKLTEKWAKRTW